MLRTYKSQKDLGERLDRCHLMGTIDEKSSVFDAYYIQNIKKVKSSLISASKKRQTHKVSKQKKVKRLGKDTQPVIEENLLPPLTYLTPNKSLRVNKGQDLFDQLLNTSSQPLDTLEIKKKDSIDKIFNRSKAKKYKGRKSSRKVYNCSDSDEEDKENMVYSKNNSQNTTNIKNHELFIEKISNSLCKLDKSIKEMQQNLLVPTKSDRKSVVNKPFINRNRLTAHIQSPKDKDFPLSSTPFLNRFRKHSIYEFSPIKFDFEKSTTEFQAVGGFDTDDKKKYLQNISDDIQSSPMLCSSGQTNFKNKENNIKYNLYINQSQNNNCVSNESLCKKPEEAEEEYFPSENKISKEFILPPKYNIKTINIINEIPLADNTSIVQNDLRLEVSSNTSKNIPNDDSDNNSVRYCEVTKRRTQFDNNNLDQVSSNNVNIDNITVFDDSISSHDFLGFTNVITDINNKSEEHNTTKMTDINKSTVKHIFNCSTNMGNEVCSSYGTCNSEVSLKTEILIKKPIVAIEKLSHTIFNQYYEKIHAIAYSNEEKEKLHLSSLSNCSIKSSKCSIASQSLSKELDCLENDVESFNDENYIESNEIHKSNESNNGNSQSALNVDTKLSLTFSNMNDTNVMFKSDTESFDDINSDSYEIHKPNKSNKVDSRSYLHDDAISSLSSSSNTDDIKVEANELQITDNLDELTSFEEFLDSTNNEEEVRCFVTVRRKNEVSALGQSNNCNHHTSNYEDVLDLNNKESSQKIAEENLLDLKIENSFSASLLKDEDLNNISNCEDVLHLHNKESAQRRVEENPLDLKKENSLSDSLLNYEDLNKVHSNIILNPKTNSSLTESTQIYKTMEDTRKTIAGMRPSIGLLPGKKWQRSLSIFRKFCNQSILEGENVNKGRKYRESVISTIELQESVGSLSNSSFVSCKSTFVSKPSRSTIRIVKDSYIPRVSLHTTLFEDLEGFLSEDCDDTVIELSKLSIAKCDKDISVLNKVHDSLDRVPTARDYVFRRCNQSAEILFDECYPDTVLKNCRKIGEGVYGEVFLWRAIDGRARVMKIVPIAGTTKVNGEPQKDYHEILSEIVIAMELSALRAPIADIERHLDEGNDVDALDLHAIENATDTFNEVLAVRCVYGPYPSRLLDLWELFDEVKGSENDCPSTLPSDQRYLVLELANAGQDLESFIFNSAEQAYALFVQVTLGLAVAEEAYQFEHRDLHWGNVLISPTDQKYATYVLRCRVYRVPRRGVSGAVIDYSLSRLALRRGALYNDLADDHSLFEAAGDYQFEVYRLMRDKLGNDWKNFEPYTNILWLHYTVDKMITALRYKRTNTKIHKQYINKLKGIKNRILDYGSAAIFVLTDNELLC